jgi:hypothetical protein
MRELKSKSMQKFLKLGLRKAKRQFSIPDDGTLCSLIYTTLKNGWHYQVEFVHDKRIRPKPYVAVFAFKPPLNFCCRSADYVLIQELDSKS